MSGPQTGLRSPAWPPEARLLFSLVTGPEDQAAPPTGPIDCGRLIHLATLEQALTVLPARLRGVGHGVVSPACLAQLGQLALVAEFHLLNLQHRFEASLRTLSAIGIETVLLKGAALGYSVYGRFGDRPMSDVDLLLRHDDATRAQRALGGSGWTWDDGAAAAAFYAQHHHLPPLFDSRGSGASLELHTELFIAGHPLALGAADVWARARPVRVAGVGAYVPHPLHQLVHACLHFAWGHMMHSGAWRTFRDVDHIVRAGDVDWDEFVRLAIETRGASCCYWTFELARCVGGVRCVPERVLRALRPPHSPVVHDAIRRHLALTLLPSASVSPSVRLDRFVWEAAIMPEHHGHGAVRPWAQEDRMASAAGGDARRGRLVANLHKVGAYRRYLRTMLAR